MRLTTVSGAAELDFAQDTAAAAAVRARAAADARPRRWHATGSARRASAATAGTRPCPPPRFRDRLPLLAILAGSLLAAGLGAAVAQNVGNYSVQNGGDWEVGGTLNVQAGGKLTTQNCLLNTGIQLNTATTDLQPFFVASRAYKVTAVRSVVATAAGGALTGVVRHVAAGTVSTGGATLTSDTIDLNAASTTPVAGTLSTTAADLLLAVGDRLLLDTSGVIAATIGNVTVCLAPQ